MGETDTVTAHTPSLATAICPSWAVVHWGSLLTWEVVGMSLEDQVERLQIAGLSRGRMVRLILSLPPPTPEGQRERVRRAARILRRYPDLFWPTVESLQVYWSIHPWSILGEPLRPGHRRAWAHELKGPIPTQDGLRFNGSMGDWEDLPDSLCASSVILTQHQLIQLPRGWIVDSLTVMDCPNLESHWGELHILKALSAINCPRFTLPPPGDKHPFARILCDQETSVQKEPLSRGTQNSSVHS